MSGCHFIWHKTLFWYITSFLCSLFWSKTLPVSFARYRYLCKCRNHSLCFAASENSPTARRCLTKPYCLTKTHFALNYYLFQAEGWFYPSPSTSVVVFNLSVLIFRYWRLFAALCLSIVLYSVVYLFLSCLYNWHLCYSASTLINTYWIELNYHHYHHHHHYTWYAVLLYIL